MSSASQARRGAAWLSIALGVLACSKPAERRAEPAAAAAATAPAASAQPSRRHAKIVIEDIAVPEAPSSLEVRWKIPAGTAVNAEAPVRIRWRSSEALENAPDDVDAQGKDFASGFSLLLRPLAGAVDARLFGELELVVCDSESHSICLPIKRELELDFSIGQGGIAKPLELPLPAAT